MSEEGHLSPFTARPEHVRSWRQGGRNRHEKRALSLKVRFLHLNSHIDSARDVGSEVQKMIARFL